MSVKIITGFDGSCPHFPEGVKKSGKNSFVVYPGYRKEEGISEEVPGKGSRFYVRLQNDGNKTEKVTVIADWETEDRTEHHDLGFIKHENDPEWEMVPGYRDNAKIEYRLSIAPGITELGLYPAYNVEERDAFIEYCKSQGLPCEVVGKSQEGREVWMISVPSENENAKNFFIQARDHAYETAGSYCVEGIVNFLLSNTPLCRYIRSKFNINIVPMTNPDGVYNGMSRLTSEKGANVNSMQIEKPDGAHTALKNAIDITVPLVMMNIHNWTDKFMDGLLANDSTIAEKVQIHMPADHENHKWWRVQTTRDVLIKEGWEEVPDWAKSWKNYCRDKYDGLGITFEFPWFNLNGAKMRKKGEKTFIAMALTAIDIRKL